MVIDQAAAADRFGGSVRVGDESDHSADPGARLLDLEDRWASAAGVVNAAAGALVELMADAIDGDLWQGYRIHSPVQWVMWRAGIGRTTARRIVLVATRSRELPTTVGLLRQGRLSLDQAATVARYTPAQYEESVCEFAVNASVAQIVAATRDYAFDVESRPEPDPGKPRHMSFGTDADGTWWARVRLSADEGVVVEQALTATRDRLHDEERAAAHDRAEREGRDSKGSDAELGVNQVGWADAMVGMANAICDHGTDGAGRSSRAKVILHLELPDPATSSDDSVGEQSTDDPTDWLAELHGGTALPSWLRRQLTCDADIELVGHRSGIPVRIWRARRTPPAKLRRLVERRDRYQCRVPGCDSSRWLQVHHIIHWEDQPDLTETWNLVCLCAKHHRLHHQGGLDIKGNADAARGDPDELVFRDPLTNRRLRSAGSPHPPEQPIGARAVRYQCPSGERLEPDLLWFAPSGSNLEPSLC